MKKLFLVVVIFMFSFSAFAQLQNQPNQGKQNPTGTFNKPSVQIPFNNKYTGQKNIQQVPQKPMYTKPQLNPQKPIQQVPQKPTYTKPQFNPQHNKPIQQIPAKKPIYAEQKSQNHIQPQSGQIPPKLNNHRNDNYDNNHRDNNNHRRDNDDRRRDDRCHDNDRHDKTRFDINFNFGRNPYIYPHHYYPRGHYETRQIYIGMEWVFIGYNYVYEWVWVPDGRYVDLGYWDWQQVRKPQYDYRPQYRYEQIWVSDYYPRRYFW